MQYYYPVTIVYSTFVLLDLSLKLDLYLLKGSFLIKVRYFSRNELHFLITKRFNERMINARTKSINLFSLTDDLLFMIYVRVSDKICLKAFR